MKRVVLLVLAIALGSQALVSAPASASSRLPGPAYSVPVRQLAKGVHCANGFPHRGRKPVLLVHGTTVTDEENWGWNYAPQLGRLGFDVCTVLMPNYALSDVQLSSEYVVYAIRDLAHKARRKISVVGLSQGSLEPRWAIKWWPDIRTVLDDYVSMAGTNHGAAFGNAACNPSCAPALWQQYARTDDYRAAPQLITALNAVDETPGDVSYTSAYSLTDWVVQPAAPRSSAALAGASNIAVQDVCPGRFVEHLQSAWDAVYYSIVIDALTHRGPARLSRIDSSVCSQLAMPGVDPIDAIMRTAVLYAVITGRQAQYPKVAAEPALAWYATVGATSGLTSWKTQTTTSGSRDYLLYEPPRKFTGRRPLVVYLHGCSERADAAAVASHYNELASRLGFFVAYPDQPTSANGNKCWNWFLPDDQHRGAGEPAILAAITKSVMQKYAVDPRRVYVTGISAGGLMSVVMAATYPELYAAVGSEAGGQYRCQPTLSAPCVVPPEQSAAWALQEMGTRARQLPLFTIVGDVDAVSPEMNTQHLKQQWLMQSDEIDNGKPDGSVRATPWSTRGGSVPGGYPYSIESYANRRGCPLMESWLVSGMDHAHSGGDADQNWSNPRGPDAAIASYRFFSRFSKQSARELGC
jgi:triacylglycerol lipase